MELIVDDANKQQNKSSSLCAGGVNVCKTFDQVERFGRAYARVELIAEHHLSHLSATSSLCAGGVNDGKIFVTDAGNRRAYVRVELMFLPVFPAQTL